MYGKLFARRGYALRLISLILCYKHAKNGIRSYINKQPQLLGAAVNFHYGIILIVIC